MALELKIVPYQKPPEIVFNHEEIERELKERIALYGNTVYTEDQMRQARADRALLRKFQDAINDERKRVKAEYTESLTDFENKMKHLAALVDEPINAIDRQIKAEEEKKKAEKKAAIETYFNSLEGKPDWLKFEQIFNERWLNATYAMSEIQNDIRNKIGIVVQDLKTLSILVFAFEATEVYKTTLDLNTALQEGARLDEIQKKKAEAEKQKAEEEKQARIDAVEKELKARIEEQAPALAPTQTEEKKGTYAIALQATTSQMEQIMKYLKEGGVPVLNLTYDKATKTFRYVPK